MFKIVIFLAATFVSDTDAPPIAERIIVQTTGSFATLLECREALQLNNDVQKTMIAATQKLNKFASLPYEEPGHQLSNKRIRAVCLPAELTGRHTLEALQSFVD